MAGVLKHSPLSGPHTQINVKYRASSSLNQAETLTEEHENWSWEQSWYGDLLRSETLANK